MPGAQRTHGPVYKGKKYTSVSHHRFAGSSRHSLRDGFTAYSMFSPETGLVVSVAGSEA